MRDIILLICMTIAPSYCPAQGQTEHKAAEKRDSVAQLEGGQLSEVTVVGGAIGRAKQSPLNVTVVDTRRLANTTQELAKAVDNVSGVKIRQEGGLGSDMQLNINGFTGKHVKIFLDGVPMEGAGSSFRLNNTPAGFAERVEIYKGVVPVELGGDAIGGAVNIVTGHRRGTYVDASYSYGSFNTHKTNVSVGTTTKSGFTASLDAYQNYTDNDYRVKVEWTDLNTSQISQEKAWFRCFNNGYHNEAVTGRLGWTSQSWADQLLLSLGYSHERKQIQNANLMKIVFGKKYRTAYDIMPSLTYTKHNLLTDGLDVRFTARYDHAVTHNVDTASRTYNWRGEYKVNPYKGEGVASLAKFTGKTFNVVTNVSYRLGEQHTFSLNNLYNHYLRNINDVGGFASVTSIQRITRKNVKDIAGLSYRYVPSRHWNLLAFGKYYNSSVRGPVIVYDKQESQAGDTILASVSTRVVGYGLAATCIIAEGLQAKLSYEKAYRMPTDRELFGDGDYEEGTANLRPECSHNLNANLAYDKRLNENHALSLDLGLTYRRVKDYIIRTIGNRGTAISTNHGKVLGVGMELNARYFFRNTLSVGGNLTLQNMRNKERLTAQGAPSVTYNNRVPNLPYQFGNVDASYNWHDLFGRGNLLTLSYNMQYVHRFFRSWSGEGAKLYIPRQLSHDASLCYSLRNGTYNIALEANNFTDALLYDNYSLQKPGRSVMMKFRVFFLRNNH